MREDCEWLGQFLLYKLFRRLTYFYRLRHSNSKVFPLFNEASGIPRTRFRSIHQIQPEKILLRTGTHMKAVAVICWVCNETAILQNNPIFRSVASGHSRGAKNSDGDERAYADSRERKPKDQTATSNLAHTLNS